MDDTAHYVMFKDETWTLQHAITCRQQGSLFDCIYTTKAYAHFNYRHYPDGLYIMEIEDSTQHPVLKEVD
jgi:hypothetical protein